MKTYNYTSNFWHNVWKQCSYPRYVSIAPMS
ncbi:hypothetical protein LSH36_1694g00000 [Paralvinella palmiformis]|uniref:Uncharacterized protein n=1 Tax=Paralvinella palmiformis TaxID=53620 RepID=A0AAD9IS91_9ANNE|nr:hypothetical protein LSH36_1694g00000 [Paralvinella palmiformis]